MPAMHAHQVLVVCCAMTRLVHQEAAGLKCSIPEPGMISDGKQQFVLESSRLMGPLGKVWIATKRYACLLLP